MGNEIKPRLEKVGNYLNHVGDESFVFEIPEYQRAYSWGIVNCDKLWQDIVEYNDSQSKDGYFFGTVIVTKNENEERFVLIDGQQRTTTFFLLLKALLLRINNAILKNVGDLNAEDLLDNLYRRRTKIMSILYRKDEDDVPRKYVKVADEQFIKANNISVIENKSINEPLYTKPELQKILSAIDFAVAESSVFKYKKKQKDNKYSNFFRNFKFFYNKMEDISDSRLNSIAKCITDNCELIVIYSNKVEQAITMFNSLNSDGLPLYDSDIISAKLCASAEKNKCVSQYTELWKKLVEETNDLSDLGFGNIDAILMQQMYYTRAANKEIISTNGNVNVTTPGVRRYFTEVNKDILKDPVPLCENMLNLAKIWKEISNYPISKVLLKFNENSKLFLASYLYKFKASDITKEKVTPIIEQMLRLFTVLELVDTGYSSSKFKIFLFSQLEKLVDSNDRYNDIKDAFDQHISKSWTRDELKESLLAYGKGSLVYLSEYLFAKEKNFPLIIESSYDIEHIMPQSGKNNQNIMNDAEIADKDEFDNYVEKLGNKILLEQKINRAVGNDWFSSKLKSDVKDRNGYANSVCPIASALVKDFAGIQKPFWKKNDIDKATDKAAERILNFIFG